jgi:hypothetical protein
MSPASSSKARRARGDEPSARPASTADQVGPFLEPTTRYALAVVAALVIAGNALLDAATGRADVLAASVRFLVAFGFAQIALRLVSGIAESYRGARAEAVAASRDEAKDTPRRRSSDQVPDGPGSVGG